MVLHTGAKQEEVVLTLIHKPGLVRTVLEMKRSTLKEQHVPKTSWFLLWKEIPREDPQGGQRQAISHWCPSLKNVVWVCAIKGLLPLLF